MLTMPRKRSSRIKTRAYSQKTATKVPRGDSSSEDTDPSRPTDMVTRLSKKCGKVSVTGHKEYPCQKENKSRCIEHSKAEDSSCQESVYGYDGDESESASQSEGMTAPPQHDVEMESDQDCINNSPECDSSSSAGRKLTRRQKPRKKIRAAVQKTPVGGVLSPSRKHITGNTPQEEVFTLRSSVEADPPTKSRPKRAVKNSTGNNPISQRVLAKNEAYNSAISPPLVGIKPLNASDTSTPSVDARGSATCSFMDDSAFGFGAMEELPSIPPVPIELVVSPVKEVSPLVNVRLRGETVSDVSSISPSKLSPSLELKLRLSPSPERKRSTRQSSRSHKPVDRACSSTNVSPTVASIPLQTTASSHASLQASTSIFKKPTTTSNTTDPKFERSVKTSPASTTTSPGSSLSCSLVSPQKRKVPAGMNDLPIEQKEKKKRRKVNKKTKAEMEAWAADMNEKFQDIASFELEVE
ncbi:streptococcal hemagglutinin-like isoform X2 [Branchiostoma lanceolatum]|uniref:streptococcal hemagglutinin-like isoform X2 n=1 Tax=Branchiostoma lanceolatum TaxID=7740 RepID=UPI00345524C3